MLTSGYRARCRIVSMLWVALPLAIGCTGEPKNEPQMSQPAVSKPDTACWEEQVQQSILVSATDDGALQGRFPPPWL
jgi:hypothetical protein